MRRAPDNEKESRLSPARSMVSLRPLAACRNMSSTSLLMIEKIDGSAALDPCKTIASASVCQASSIESLAAKPCPSCKRQGALRTVNSTPSPQ